jgi:hypothetical protein
MRSPGSVSYRRWRADSDFLNAQLHNAAGLTKRAQFSSKIWIRFRLAAHFLARGGAPTSARQGTALGAGLPPVTRAPFSLWLRCTYESSPDTSRTAGDHWRSLCGLSVLLERDDFRPKSIIRSSPRKRGPSCFLLDSRLRGNERIKTHHAVGTAFYIAAFHRPHAFPCSRQKHSTLSCGRRLLRWGISIRPLSCD